ncbi:MAG TPA: EamA family transporter [Thermoanaerobaculia bacterium]|nr:EamA family transporter [Thermoanaerobaculia bacterium]
MVLIWGTTWAAIRIGLEGIPPITGVALRFAIAGAVLLALVPVFGVKLGRSPGERGLWVSNTLFTFVIAYGILYWAEQWVPSGLAAVLFATFPLFVAVIAHFALPAERLTAASIAGVLIGFVGVAVIFSEDFRALGGSRVLLASAVLLISPFSAAFGNVIVKRRGEGVHPLSISAVPMAMTGVLMGALALVFESDRTVTFDTRSVLALLYLALVGSALPFTLFFWLLKYQPASRLALINYATPVVAVAVGSLFLDEPFTLRILLGAALVVSGVAVAVVVKPSPPRPSSPTPPSPSLGEEGG